MRIVLSEALTLSTYVDHHKYLKDPHPLYSVFNHQIRTMVKQHYRGIGDVQILVIDHNHMEVWYAGTFLAYLSWSEADYKIEEQVLINRGLTKV